MRYPAAERNDVPGHRHHRAAGVDLGQLRFGSRVADLPRVLEQRIVVVQDHDVLAGLCVREHVVVRDVDEPAGLHGEYLVAVGVDEGELLFHLQHLLFPP